MNLQFHHPARLAAWSLIIGQLICGAALRSAAAPRLHRRKPDKSDTASAAETKDIGKDWVRMKYDSKDEPIAMQTAIVRYTPAKSNGKTRLRRDGRSDRRRPHRRHRLLSKTERQFSQYDALLYELVAPEGTRCRSAAARRTRIRSAPCRTWPRTFWSSITSSNTSTTRGRISSTPICRPTNFRRR